MPRICRLDWDGSLHHVMARGVNRCEIFRTGSDKTDFVLRLAHCREDTGISVIAWALMPNHIHLLLRTAEVPLWKFMHKLLTGHAGYFNTRYARTGHLFQNRFLSILVQNEPYALKLISYIHLNPFRAGLVNNLEELDEYPWTSHYGLFEPCAYPWQDTWNYLIELLANKKNILQEYRELLASEANDSLENTWECEYGNYMMGADGITPVDPADNHGLCSNSQYRILGDYEFSKHLLEKVRIKAGEQIRNRAQERSMIESVLKYASSRWELPPESLVSGRRRGGISEAREFLSYVFTNILHLRLSDSAGILHISTSGVRAASARFPTRDGYREMLSECFRSDPNQIRTDSH